MNIYEEKLIIVGGWDCGRGGGGRRGEERRREEGSGGTRHLFLPEQFWRTSSAAPLRSDPSCPSAPDHRAGRGLGQIRSPGPHPTPIPQIWRQPLCPSKCQTGSLAALRSRPHSHNCVMEVFLNCNLITILIALNAIMMGNKQEESRVGGVGWGWGSRGR